jgi:hypothetical protein
MRMRFGESKMALKMLKTTVSGLRRSSGPAGDGRGEAAWGRGRAGRP